MMLSVHIYLSFDPKSNLKLKLHVPIKKSLKNLQNLVVSLVLPHFFDFRFVGWIRSMSGHYINPIRVLGEVKP